MSIKNVKKKLVAVGLIAIMAISSSLSIYAAEPQYLTLVAKSGNTAKDKSYTIKYADTSVGSASVCASTHTAMVSMTTNGIIKYYVESTTMTARYYESNYPGAIYVYNTSHVGTENGNQSKCLKKFGANQYVRATSGTISLNGFWSYGLSAVDNENH